MNPYQSFEWLSLEPRRDAPPRTPPPTRGKPPTEPVATILKSLRRNQKHLRRRVRVLERSRNELMTQLLGERKRSLGPPRLPLKIIPLIAAHLAATNSLATLAALSTTSKALRKCLLPILYRCVIWDTVEVWQKMFPHVRKRFRIEKRKESWIHTKYLIIASEIWDIIQTKAARLFPNLDVVIIKNATYARTYDPKHRSHLTAPGSLALPDDESALMPLEFMCDIDVRGSVSDSTLSALLRIPLKWSYGSRTLTRTIRTVKTISVKPRGVIRSESSGPHWTPCVPHQNLECTIEATEPSRELLDTMRYLCRFIHPSMEWAGGGGNFGADGTFSLSPPGGLEIYNLFTQLLEDILSQDMVINVNVNLGTPNPPIAIPAFEESMLLTADIYSRAWLHILRAQALRQPRYQWDKWSIFSIQYTEPAVDSQGLRHEYASYAQITTLPNSPTFQLGISHAGRFQYRFAREYGPFGVVEE